MRVGDPTKLEMGEQPAIKLRTSVIEVPCRFFRAALHMVHNSQMGRYFWA